jgi:prefoldin beta subunit
MTNTEDVQQILNKFQLYQQQMQNIVAQKTASSLELHEIKKALEEIEKTKEESVYKISGPILIKNSTEDVKKELKERDEILTVRIKSIEKQEKEIRAKMEELRKKLSELSAEGG